ncbi:hypothetical protein GGP41_004246 [Bipolaris sorokiniana]|uniref:Uncharacterized protein n=1 Tax=Cochliobolus sativus TaxID=45130 RepID=A0A8H5ZLS1_COCSA|nr:hypothetical protein GGP41_004246 [Bipolaris sorokiniana]
MQLNTSVVAYRGDQNSAGRFGQSSGTSLRLLVFFTVEILAQTQEAVFTTIAVNGFGGSDVVWPVWSWSRGQTTVQILLTSTFNLSSETAYSPQKTDERH